MKYLVAGVEFKNKALVIERAQEILWRVPLGTALEGWDFAFIRELVDTHPLATDIIGEGIEFICPDLDVYKSQCFWAHRSDGTRRAFSKNNFLSRKTATELTATNRREHVIAAFRNAISSQIIAFRDSEFASHDVSCPFTGEKLTPGTCDVDHAKPHTFENLLADFLNNHGLTRDLIETKGDHTNEQVKLVDQKISRLWEDFHAHRAVLRVVSLQANRSILRRKE
jgi:hypothetical protein